MSKYETSVMLQEHYCDVHLYLTDTNTTVKQVRIYYIHLLCRMYFSLQPYYATCRI